MRRPVDLVVGAIYDLNDDRQAGWSAYFAADIERDKLIAEVERLRKLLRKKEVKWKTKS